MYIVITLPEFFDGEAEAITLKFQAGLERLHLRKPESTADECRALLHQIPCCYHHRIVVHDHFELAEEFGLLGIHLNRRHPEPPAGWQGSISCSCHSMEEVEQMKKCCDYVTLSPIFNSISKQGYNAAFTREQLLKAQADGIIDKQVMALGGISPENIEEALSYGFGGVMVLGDAWASCRPHTPQQTFNASRMQGPTTPKAVVLSIAGSDPSAGAGIQQDLKAMTNCGVYGTTVITALTSQNTMGVQGVMPVPAEVVESQLRSVFSDIRIDAVKIGMIPNQEVAHILVKVLREERTRRTLPIVCDPIMLSTSGTRLMDESCIDYVVQNLFPLCTLITPNLPEYEVLSASYCLSDHCTAVLRKGGHAAGDDMNDTLFIFAEKAEKSFSSQRIVTRNLHGTGCTLSSAIASHLALGHSLSKAVAAAKTYITKAIEGGQTMTIGHGNGPLWFNP